MISTDLLLKLGLAASLLLIMYLTFAKRCDCYANLPDEDEDAEEAFDEDAGEESDEEDEEEAFDEDAGEDSDAEDDDEDMEDSDDDEDAEDSDEEEDSDAEDAEERETFSLMKTAPKERGDAPVFTPPGF